jgi:hypothetical protein
VQEARGGGARAAVHMTSIDGVRVREDWYLTVDSKSCKMELRK